MKFSPVISIVCLAGLAACATPKPPPPPQQAAAPPPPPVAQAAAKPSAESLVIEFNDGSATLSPTAQSQLDDAARLYRDARPEIMTVTGHADKTGQEYPNLILSAQRARSVQQGLVDRGLPVNRLQIVADGESQRTPGEQPGKTAVVTWR